MPSFVVLVVSPRRSFKVEFVAMMGHASRKNHKHVSKGPFVSICFFPAPRMKDGQSVTLKALKFKKSKLDNPNNHRFNRK